MEHDPEKVRAFVDWMKAVPGLVEAVLALNERVKTLENQVAELKQKEEQ